MDKVNYIYSFLLVVLFVSCEKTETSYYISNVRAQRIEIEGSLSKDSLYYLLDFSMEYNSEWKVIRPWMLNRKPVEKITGIIVEDSLHEDIITFTKVFDGHNGGNWAYPIVPMSKKNQKGENVVSCYMYEDWNSLISYLNRMCHPYSVHKFSIFSISKSMHLPAYFILKMETREIRVKVNNTPVRYKVHNR